MPGDVQGDGGGYTRAVSLFKSASTVSLLTLVSRITGLVRELLSQVQALELSQSDLHEIVTQLEAGQSRVAQTDLLARGLEAGEVNPFLRNLSALPDTLLVPQTTRTLRPRRASGENNE